MRLLSPVGYRRFTLAGLFGLATAAIFLSPFLTGSSQTLVRYSIGLFAAELVRIDGKIIEQPVSRGFLIGNLFLWPALIPYHLVQTRGWKRSLKFLAWAALYIAVVCAVLLMTDTTDAD